MASVDPLLEKYLVTAEGSGEREREDRETGLVRRRERFISRSV